MNPEQFVELAREDSPRGFAMFYTLVHNKVIPAHVMRWVEQVYAAKAENRGALIEAFRGSTKSNRREDLLVFLTPRILTGAKAQLLPSAEDLWQHRGSAEEG